MKLLLLLADWLAGLFAVFRIQFLSFTQISTVKWNRSAMMWLQWRNWTIRTYVHRNNLPFLSIFAAEWTTERSTVCVCECVSVVFAVPFISLISFGRKVNTESCIWFDIVFVVTVTAVVFVGRPTWYHMFLSAYFPNEQTKIVSLFPYFCFSWFFFSLWCYLFN